MINVNPSAIPSLSAILSENLDTLKTSMARVATGKKAAVPGDGFADYFATLNMQSDITALVRVKQNLAEGKGLTDYAQAVGNTMVEDTTRLTDLQARYANAEGDTVAQSAYAAQYAGVYDYMTNLAANARYNDVAVYRSETTLATINLGTAGADIAVSVQANQIADLTAIGNITTVTAADLQNSLQGAQNYVAAMQGFGNSIEKQRKLTDTLVAAKNANISQLVDVNEVEELRTIINAQVRSQASVAMAAQANSAKTSIARLFQ